MVEQMMSDVSEEGQFYALYTSLTSRYAGYIREFELVGYGDRLQ